MYKLIAMDFDGTLLTDDKKVLEKTKNKLIECKNKDYYIIGVTARNLESAKNVVTIDLFNYLILNNGASIYDVKKGIIISEKFISTKDIKTIIDSVDKKSIQIDLISSNIYYIYKNKLNSPLKFIIDINDINDINEKISRMNIFIENQEEIDYVYELLNNRFKNLNIIIMQDSDSFKKWIVVNPLGINKLESLKNISQQHNISTDEIIFFGDGLNDLEVIKNIECGVAMGNALDVVKENANYITNTNNENGIAEFLDKYIIK